LRICKHPLVEIPAFFSLLYLLMDEIPLILSSFMSTALYTIKMMTNINEILFKIEQLERELKDVINIIDNEEFTEQHRLKTIKERIQNVISK